MNMDWTVCLFFSIGWTPCIIINIHLGIKKDRHYLSNFTKRNNSRTLLVILSLLENFLVFSLVYDLHLDNMEEHTKSQSMKPQSMKPSTSGIPR